MAEGKKGVLVYADWLKKFESLTDEEAGRLVKHLFRYINDLHPVAPDRTTELLFIDIETTLKRDLKKWEKSLEVKSVSGRVGNLKRWHPDLHKKYLSKELTIDECESIAQRLITSHSDVKDHTATKTVANIAVSVSDSVSVSDIYISEKDHLKKVLLEEKWFMSIRNRLAGFYQSDEHLLKLLDEFCELKKLEPFNDDRHRYHSFVRYVETKHNEAKPPAKKEESKVIHKYKTARD